MATDDETLRGAKREARRRMRERLAGVTADQRRAWSETAAGLLLRAPECAGPGCRMVFASMPEEIDTEPLVRGWLEAGVPVALPRIDAAGGEIRAYRIDGLDRLEANRWGIREPAPDPAAEIRAADLAVIVVPGLAFDRGGGRLGRGRGYYDRFLREAGRDPLRAGLFYAIQELDRVPAGAGDERLDVIFTERGTIRRAGDPGHS